MPPPIFKEDIIMIDWTQIIITIVTLILTAVIVPWLRSKTNNESLQKVITEVGDAVATATDSIAKTFVDDIKADGKLSDEAKAKAMNDAISIVKNNISQKTIDYLKVNSIDMETYIKTKIEAYLKRGEL